MQMFARLARWRFAYPFGRRKGHLLPALLWTGLAVVFARGFTVLGMLVAARILGRESFGQLGIVYQTVMTLQVFAVAGLGTTATTFVARWLAAEPERVTRIIVLCYGFTAFAGGLFALGLSAAAEPIAAVVLAAPALADELRFGALLMLVVAIVAVQNGMLIGFKAFRDMAMANLISGTASLVLLPLGAHQLGVAGALYGLAAALVLQGVICHTLIKSVMHRNNLPLRLVLPREELSLLWRFSLPSVLTVALWTLATWTASALLVRQPNGMAEMGLLAAANQWFSALMFVPGVLTQVLLPTYSEHLVSDRPIEARRLALRSARLVLLGISPLVALLVVFSPTIAGLYGAEFANGGPVFAAVFLAAGVMSPYGALTNYLVAHQRMWTRFAISILWSATLLVGVFLLVKWGAFGVGLASLFAYTVRATVTYAFVRWLL